MLLSGIISAIFIKNDNYDKESKKLMELTQSYTEGKMTKEEYTKEFDNVNYYLTKDSVSVTMVNCGVAIVYYVIMCFYCGGITLGKYIMKLRIISANDKELNIGNYLLRSLFVNLVLSNIMSIILVSALSKDSFIKIYPKVSNALTLFLLVTLIFIMYREDGRGLHDLIANTKIISTKYDKKNVEVVEAKVVEEKKMDDKEITTKKKAAKKSTKKDVK